MNRFGVFLAKVVGLTLLLALAGILPTRNLAGPAGVAALAAGCVTALVAAAAGALPAVLSRRPSNAIVTALAAMGLRLGVVLGGGLLLVFGTPLPRAPLLVWICICYLALMPLETRFVIRESERATTAKLREKR